jgi:arylsulfatase A-like enzyme
MNILCVSVDGLHCGMTGAFGNTWIQTPTFDACAGQGILFDRYYTDTLDLTAIFGTLFQSELQYAAEKLRTILVTDDTDVFFHPLANDFDEQHVLENFRGKTPVTELEQTQFCKAFAAVTDILDGIDVDSQSFLLHLHLEGFRGHWDFPYLWRKKFQDAQDPVPYSKTEPPQFINADPDTQQSVIEAYSGGIAVFDAALAGLLEYLGYLEDTILIITATRGFSLGEHGKIGGNDDDVYNENVHLPLMIRFPKSRNTHSAGYRSQTLLLPQDVFPLLADILAGQSDIPLEPQEIHSSLHIGNALLTPDWFYIPPQEGAAAELYAKPDDRWETNNVADRCPHIIESFE